MTVRCIAVLLSASSVSNLTKLDIIKWVGTAAVIIAASSRAFGFHAVDLWLSIVGAGLWAWASIEMKDKPLIVVNAYMTAILLIGLFR